MIRISKKKQFYPVNPALGEYLGHFGRQSAIPVVYEKMRGFAEAFPLLDREHRDTLWKTVSYDPYRLRELNLELATIYALLKTGDTNVLDHLFIERIDFCEFGNSQPFRVRVVNKYNDNYDHFYVKVADSSRIYGLELEYVLSPNRINYFVNGGTLIEEHIAGIPGDVFIKDYFGREEINEVRVAKEFVKFNERCFVRLLGDMRSYNWVVDITPDFEDIQYRVRAIDFDQQSYEGNVKVYLAQHFVENASVVRLCTKHLNYPTIQQYQREERNLILRRVQMARTRLQALLQCMGEDECAPAEQVAELRGELGVMHETNAFADCRTMGDLVKRNIEFVLSKE
ncbi:MAG: hypothetical protein ACC661_02595 [Verrucomicrobiales bacterium]